MALPEPTGGFEWVQVDGRPALRCRPLESFAPHIFTTRPWRLGSSDRSSSDAGWADVAAAMQVDANRVARLRQVHGSTVRVTTRGNAAVMEEADIQIADESGVALVVQTADCLPILLADSRTGAIAAAHAGWRGLAARVPGVAVGALAQRFGSRPSDLVAAIGPSVSACCYEVGVDVRTAFDRMGFETDFVARWFFDRPRPTPRNPSMPTVLQEGRSEHWFFDPWASARDQLERAGVSANQIHVAELCSASHPDWFCSYRRDGHPAGRMAAAIRRS